MTVAVISISYFPLSGKLVVVPLASSTLSSLGVEDPRRSISGVCRRTTHFSGSCRMFLACNCHIKHLHMCPMYLCPIICHAWFLCSDKSECVQTMCTRRQLVGVPQWARTWLALVGLVWGVKASVPPLPEYARRANPPSTRASMACKSLRSIAGEELTDVWT